VSVGTPLPRLSDQGPVLAGAQVLPAPGPLAPFLPGSGLRRGSLVSLSGQGKTTLALSLLSAPVAQGAWAAVVGLPELGVEAAAVMGVDLTRVALVPEPGPSWPNVLAVLLDSLDLVVVRPPRRPRPAEARRLVARARAGRAVLCVLGGWPEAPDVALAAETEAWVGLGRGSGWLRARRGRVVVTGRGSAGRPIAVPCWLPGPDGQLAARGPAGMAVAPEAPEAAPWAG